MDAGGVQVSKYKGCPGCKQGMVCPEHGPTLTHLVFQASRDVAKGQGAVSFGEAFRFLSAFLARQIKTRGGKK